MDLQDRFVYISRTIDAELLRSIINNSGLDRRIESENITDDTLYALSKKILKDALRGSSVIRRNRDGFSVSYTSEKIQTLSNFLREANMLMRVIRNTPEGNELSQFIEHLYNPRFSEQHYYFFRSHFQFNTESSKVMFFFRYCNYHQSRFYANNNLVFYCIFELIHLIEELEDQVNKLSRFYEIQQQERERYEAQRREEERRQRLLQQGFSREGVSLSERLEEILRTRGGRR